MPAAVEQTPAWISSGRDDEAAARLERRLIRQMSRLNKRERLIEAGDRILVAVSGGKDSWSMLHLLREYVRRLPFDVSLVAVNVDQGHPGFPVDILRRYLDSLGVEHRIVFEDTHTVVKANTPAGKAFCSLCSRLRRGILYRVASELGANKVALGHHRDDVVETFLLNAIYAGQLKAMPCKLRSDSGLHEIIRPLASSAERDVGAYAAAIGAPIVPCDLCGSQENLRRQRMKAMLASLSEEDARIPANIFAALGNVKPSHLWDHALRDGTQAGDVDDGEVAADEHDNVGGDELGASTSAVDAVAPRDLIPLQRLVR